MTPTPVEILAVDDTPRNLAALEAVLGQGDVTVVRAGSGAEALDLVQAHDYAVVILDAQMPQMDGFEVARRIRQSERGGATPIIFLTAFDTDPPEVRRAYASGAVDFVIKPFDPQILRSKVTVFVELFRQRRELAAQGQFLATLAHELRNPLTSLLAVAEMLEQQPVEDPQLARRHELIHRQVVHLLRVVEDSLEISRFAQGKLELRVQRLDVRDAIQRAVEIADAGLASRGIQLAVSLPPEPIRVAGDSVRLAQVVANLLDNAAKFNVPDGRVWVSLEETEREAVIRVRDSGRGIAPDQLARIFEPFVQGEPDDAAHGGLGIGLALVKQVVELHGGRVAAASGGSGLGAELEVRLPLAPGPSSMARPRPARVLVVDDNPEIRSTLKAFLQLEGHSVLTADCGRVALDQIRQTDPDVVLLDITLPDLDGYTVAKQVRAARPDWRPRLIAMTGNVGPLERDRARLAGFDAHLSKPVDGRTLLRVVAGG